MAKHKPRQQRKEYQKRFGQRYGMTVAEYRELKKTDPTKAHEVRMKAQDRFYRSLESKKLESVT